MQEVSRFSFGGLPGPASLVGLLLVIHAILKQIRKESRPWSYNLVLNAKRKFHLRSDFAPDVDTRLIIRENS